MHDAHRLAHRVGHLEAAACALLAGLERSRSRARRASVEPLRARSAARSSAAGYLSPHMATFDQLSAEQRAIIELVLKQGQSYDELGDMLGLPTSRVRELAREALVRLSPVSAAAVDDDWRGQLADYLLNQQAGPEATATRGHLRRSEAARGWARSVLDSLDHLYDERQRARHPRGRGRRRRAAASRMPRRAAREGRRASTEVRGGAGLSPEARSAVKRRRLIAGGAVALVAAAGGAGVAGRPAHRRRRRRRRERPGRGRAVADRGPARAAPAGRGTRHQRRRGGRGGRAGRRAAS